MAARCILHIITHQLGAQLSVDVVFLCTLCIDVKDVEGGFYSYCRHQSVLAAPVVVMGERGDQDPHVQGRVRVRFCPTLCLSRYNTRYKFTWRWGCWGPAPLEHRPAVMGDVQGEVVDVFVKIHAYHGTTPDESTCGI